jgi:hypothetical protein
MVYNKIFFHDNCEIFFLIKINKSVSIMESLCISDDCSKDSFQNLPIAFVASLVTPTVGGRNLVKR